MENPYIEMLKRVQSQAKASGASSTATSLDEYNLGGIDCAECNNTGVIPYVKNGILYSRECGCMERRRDLRRIRNSGLADLLGRYTFDTFKADDIERKQIKVSAMEYANAPKGWFYINGKPGSGKTHICTAICGRLMEIGKPAYYAVWRDEISKLKEQMIEAKEDYIASLRKLQQVTVLYIDDFFKGKITEADINIAYEIINARYNDSKLHTIISSELSIERVMDIDEALGSRIYERCKWHYLEAPRENWRLR